MRPAVLLFACSLGLALLAGCGGEDAPIPATTTHPPSGTPSPAATGTPALPDAAREAVSTSAAFFLYLPRAGETLGDVARRFGGAEGRLTPEQLAARNRLATTALPLPLLAVPLVIDEPGELLPTASVRAGLAASVPLVTPSGELLDRFRGRLALRSVALDGGEPARGYLLEFWTTSAPVAKGGEVDPSARFDAPAFAIAAGTLAGAEPFAGGARSETVVEGVRVAVWVPAGSPLAPAELLAGLSSGR